MRTHALVLSAAMAMPLVAQSSGPYRIANTYTPWRRWRVGLHRARPTESSAVHRQTESRDGRRREQRHAAWGKCEGIQGAHGTAIVTAAGTDSPLRATISPW